MVELATGCEAPGFLARNNPAYPFFNSTSVAPHPPASGGASVKDATSGIFLNIP
jgi:hypothetical protein